jgi:hypothetical protein
LKKILLIIFVVLSTSCTSIPFTSMLKIASMNDKDLLSIKADKIRARITINQPAKLRTKNVNLVLRFEFSGEGEREYALVLDLLDYREISNSDSWFSASTKRHQYDFKVKQESISEFKKYQREFVKFGKPSKYYWTVYYYLENRPDKGQPINLDLELKFDIKEDYFYLLKGAELDVT